MRPVATAFVTALLALALARSVSAAPTPTPTPTPTPAPAEKPPATAPATPAAKSSPSPTPHIAMPARGVGEPGSVKSVALLAHAPGVPNATTLARTVGDVLKASGIEVRSGDALLRSMDADLVDPFTEVRKHVSAASQRYLTLDLAAADAELRAAEDALAPALADPESVLWTRRILELRAVVFMAQDRVDASTEKLSALFLLDPEYRADERFLSPQFAPAFEKAAEGAALAPRGTVTVRTQPIGAEIYVDGKAQGNSPATLDLRTGQHVVQAVFWGYQSAGAALRVDPAVPGEVTLTLKELDGAGRKSALARSIATALLPAGRAEAATLVRTLSQSDAVAILLARPSADGTLLSGEVHWDDPRIPPSRTPEFRLTSIASANARALAAGLEKILVGPKPKPVVWKGRYIPPEVPDPFTLQLSVGRVDNYGTGWRKTDIPGRLVGATINLTGVFRQQEQEHVALDWTFAFGFQNGSICYGGTGPENCKTVTSNQAFLDASPRLELRAWRLFGFGAAGLGIGNHEMSVQVAPDAPVQKDTVVVARAFLDAGIGMQVTRKFRIHWEEKIATAQGTFPTTITREYKARHLNVGGIVSEVAISYRF